MTLLLGIAAGIGLAAGTYALFVRPRILQWGASQEEAGKSSPDGDLIPDGARISTMAVTIGAPPSAVWPWLVQMGFDRAGWYSWDRLDRFGLPSARRIHPEWQSLSVGQRLLATPGGKHWFDVADVEPERFLALRMFTSGRRQLDSRSAFPRPSSFTDSLWSFELDALPGERTRLIVRVHVANRPRLFPAVLGFLLWEPAHFVMQVRQFTNLKRRAETTFREARSARSARASVELKSLPDPPI
jgi:proline iminopeptidase